MVVGSDRIMNMIMRIAREEGADPAAMLATSFVESGFNPRAVGDGGTSYGLFQHHVGGAGGGTQASARSFMNPEKSIRERARNFSRMGIRGGRGAASLQRPADPSGYARKVDAQLPRFRKIVQGGGGMEGSVSTPKRDSGVSQGNPAGWRIDTSGVRTMLLGMLGDSDDSVLTALQDFNNKYNQVLPDVPVEQQASEQIPTKPRGKAKPSKLGASPTGTSYRFAQNIGVNKFNLRNDPGTTQTTGGRHAAGSLHYAGRAVDFGNARNTPTQLKAYAGFMRRKYGKNIKELYYAPLGWHIDNGKVYKGAGAPGHGDHLHIAT